MFRYLIALCLMLFSLQASAFTPAATKAKYRQAITIPAARPTRNTAFVLRMSEEEKQVSAESKISADGTFYDDEVSTAISVCYP